LNRNKSRTVFQKVCEIKTDTSAFINKRNLKKKDETAAIKKTELEESMEKLPPTEEVGIETDFCFGKTDIAKSYFS
jgi:hypothetical protein